MHEYALSGLLINADRSDLLFSRHGLVSGMKRWRGPDTYPEGVLEVRGVHDGAGARTAASSARVRGSCPVTAQRLFAAN